MNQFRLVQPIYRLSQGVVVAVTTTTHRGLYPSLGEALGVGGHLTALRRTRVGGYPLDLAHSLDALEELVTAGGALPVLPLAAAAAAALPTRFTDAAAGTSNR